MLGLVRSRNEYVVLVNEDAEPIGIELKAAVHHASTPLHLAFSIFLFDGKGRALFQQRAYHKPTWPGIWSNSCCGHPMPGESLDDAARRRLRHELGIMEPVCLELALPDFRYRARWREVWENEVCPVFVGTYTGPLSPNPEEVTGLRWIDWRRFASECRRGDARAFGLYSPWSRWEAAALVEAGRDAASRMPLAV